MVEQKIELRQIRDFGMNINDTFTFLKQNLKPLLTCVFAICGIFMLGQAIFNGIYQSHSMGFLKQIFSGAANTNGYNSRYAGLFSIEYIMSVLCMMLTYVSMKLVLGAYMKYYLEHDGQSPGIEDIWNIYKRYFFRIFIYSIIPGIFPWIGLVFCVIPGVYLWIVFVPFTFIIMIEDVGFGTAFNRCFEIVKDNFWISFAIYIIALIIYVASSYIVGGVVGAIAGVAAYFTTKNIGTTVGIVTSFLNIFSFIFYIIYFTSAALQYFTLTEQHDGTGILNRIDNIGTDKNNFDNTEEQY